jgi:hypothetical protein
MGAVAQRRFEERFTAERMARSYVDVYQDLLEQTAPRSLALQCAGE